LDGNEFAVLKAAQIESRNQGATRSRLRLGQPRFSSAASRVFKRTHRPLQEENIMGVIGWIVFGLVVGVVAKFLMPGRDPGGFFVTILLGIVGAIVGGFLGRAVGWYGPGDPVGFVMAVLGAIALLVAYRLIARRPRQA
jgi:uncharacterized membrane protein YeaQ/YmgE (transglycosylase-associated protein family)